MRNAIKIDQTKSVGPANCHESILRRNMRDTQLELGIVAMQQSGGRTANAIKTVNIMFATS